MEDRVIAACRFLGANPAMRRAAAFVVAEFAAIFILLRLSHDAHSAALKSTAFFNVFVCFCLLVKILSECVPHLVPRREFSFGYARLEVIAVFSSVTLCVLGSVFVVKEGFESFFHTHHPHSSSGGPLLGIGAIVGFGSQVAGLRGARCKALDTVFETSSTGWFQERIHLLARTLSRTSPQLSRMVRKFAKINPCYIVACSNLVSLFLLDLLVPEAHFRIADLGVSLWTAALISTTMWPFIASTSRILMQFPPPHLSTALDLAIAEIGTAVDGVLECQDERFWQLGFTGGSSSTGVGRCLAGALRVRARRDADERLVVRGVAARLSHLVSHLTVHVFKDDWAFSSVSVGRSLLMPPPYVPVVKPVLAPANPAAATHPSTSSCLLTSVSFDPRIAQRAFVVAPDANSFASSRFPPV